MEVLLRDGPHLLIELKGGLDESRQPHQVLNSFARLIAIDSTPCNAEFERQQIVADDLRREGFGRGYADLRPRVGIEDIVALPSDRGFPRVTDGNNPRPTLPALS